jgi:coniferyl-aldehyde dehydrogenase
MDFNVQATEAAAIADLKRALALQKNAHLAAPYPDAGVRIDRIQRLLAALKKERVAIEDAICQDFGNRSKNETLIFEMVSCLEDVKHTVKHLRKWMKPERRPVSLNTPFSRCEIIKQPLGVVGIIVPWNYPMFLAVTPLVAALAAGNRAIVKMSEYTPRFSALFAELIARTFSEEEVHVVNGGPELAQAFSAEPFDHILFTGSTAVGRHVMRAAADHLTPVTLELGGKSPTIIADDADLASAVRSLIFGKMANAGQTCVAPDYVLVPRGKEQAFIDLAKQTVKTFYPTLQGNPDYTCVVNDRQASRIRRYVDDAKAQGATVHPLHDEPAPPESRQFVPLAFTNVNDGMQVMQEEIFGPLLPVMSYDRFEDAIDYVNRHDRPLALYLYTSDRAKIDKVLYGTTSGGVVINDVMMHVIQNDLPFGGVGPSGMGHYHGREGFNTFSKLKGVLRQSRLNGITLLHPPRDNGRLRKMIEWLVR